MIDKGVKLLNQIEGTSLSAENGYREIQVAPYLEFCEEGLPGRIPGNALLRIKIWVQDVQKQTLECCAKMLYRFILCLTGKMFSVHTFLGIILISSSSLPAEKLRAE